MEWLSYRVLPCHSVIVDLDVEHWLLEQEREADPVEAEMRASGTEREFPIVGPLVGRLLDVLTRTSGAKRVFEMGSGFGYSTWWFARAVGKDGHVVHTDGASARSQEAQNWLGAAGVADRCRFLVGDALDLLAEEEETYDIVFIDVDKGDYPRAWRLARDKVRPGGLVIADNTLWGGLVADAKMKDEWTQAVREYVHLATTDRDFSTTVIPLRDGVAVSVRH